MSLFALFHSPNRHQCDEFNLVLQAVSIDSEVTEYEGRYYLLVPEQESQTAYAQLSRYVAENTDEIHIAKPLLPFSKGYVAAYVYVIALLLVSLLENMQMFGLDWQQSGLADSLKIAQGQWWRNITALTLHANSAHMAGNIGFGVLFALFVSQYIGSGAAWLTILLSGIAGNAINAGLYQTLHQSLGASTMVFAALGVLGIFALNRKPSIDHRPLRRWLPFISTLALLAMIGTAGERTDVLAHLTGYFSGCVAGMLWVIAGIPQFNSNIQQLTFGLICILIIVFAWALALA